MIKEVDLEALTLVVETAHDWAGEYGFGMPKTATKIFQACHELLPDTYLGGELVGHMAHGRCGCGKTHG